MNSQADKTLGVKGVEELRPIHYVEYGLMKGVFGFAALFGVERASGIGGWLARTFAPLFPPHKTARANLKAAFPEKSDDEINRILKDMWENFGRTMFEIPLLGKLLPYGEGALTTVKGAEIIDEVLAEGKGAIFIASHCANWEVLPTAIRRKGYELNGVYRAANNPLVNDWIIRIRGDNSFSILSPKGNAGAKKIVESIRKNIPIAMLIDQKMSEGLEVDFFGRPAKTPGAPAQLALKYGCPLVPVHGVRTKGAHFEVTFFPPLEVPSTGNKSEDQLALTRACNAFLEEQISAHPAQWMWMHNRWTLSPRAIERRRKRAEKAARQEARS